MLPPTHLFWRYLLPCLLLLCALSLVAWPSTSASTPPATPLYCQGIYQGDTSTGVSETDRYPCRPDWPETGPEILYRLHTTFTQPLTLTLSYPQGSDLDLFLLPNGEPENCHGSDAHLSLPSLPPGDHLIAIDGFQDSRGPYTLVVTCDQPPLATPTPTDLPPPTYTPTPTPQRTPTPTPTITPTPPHLDYYIYLPSHQRNYPPPTPQPSTLILQHGVGGYDGLIDSYLNAWEISTNYANVDRLSLRQTDVMAPILRLRLDGLPANAHIVAAELQLWSLSQSNTNPATVGLYQLHRPWNIAEVSWQQAAVGDLWVAPGANAAPQDREDLPRSVQQVDAFARWYAWDVTDLVQGWLFAPPTNHGVILKAFAPPKVLYTFASAEYHNPEARPRLVVHYWTPTPPPSSHRSSPPP